MADALQAGERAPEFALNSTPDQIVRSGVNRTPTFFINGVRHNGGYDLQSLVAALREAL